MSRKVFNNEPAASKDAAQAMDMVRLVKNAISVNSDLIEIKQNINKELQEIRKVAQERQVSCAGVLTTTVPMDLIIKEEFKAETDGRFTLSEEIYIKSRGEAISSLDGCDSSSLRPEEANIINNEDE